MLEGLEAIELNFSELENEFTIGSEYYKQEFVQIVDNLKESDFQKSELKNSTTLITDGDHGSTQYKESGILYLLSESINEGYIDLNGNGTRYISKELNNELKRSILKTGDVVVTKTGVYFGKSAVIPKEIDEANTSAHVAKIVVDKNILNPYFLSTFLNSKFGYSQLRRRGIKVSRPEIKLVEFQDVLIAIPDLTFQEKIEELVLKGQEFLEKSRLEYREAEAFLLESIRLDSPIKRNDPVNIKTLSESFLGSGRLDAEYYQNKYEDFENVVKAYKDGFTFIGKEYQLVKDRSKKLEKYYNYIEIGDVNVSDGSATYNEIKTEDLPANAKTEVEKGDMLISKVRPNRGAVTIIDFKAENLIVSGAFTVLREKEESVFSTEVLKVLLRTNIYKEWLLKFNVGAQYPVIRDEDVMNMPIPKIDQSIQKIVKEKVRLSQDFKKKSETMLENAKLAVEVAIEKGEVAASNFIETTLAKV